MSLCLDVVSSCDNYARLGAQRDGQETAETVAEGPGHCEAYVGQSEARTDVRRPIRGW